MKHLLLTASFLICFTSFFAQPETLLPGDYATPYEQEILNKKDATLLEQLMAFQGLDIIALRNTLPNLQKFYLAAESDSGMIPRPSSRSPDITPSTSPQLLRKQ